MSRIVGVRGLPVGYWGLPEGIWVFKPLKPRSLCFYQTPGHCMLYLSPQMFTWGSLRDPLRTPHNSLLKLLCLACVKSTFCSSASSTFLCSADPCNRLVGDFVNVVQGMKWN